MMKLKLRPEVQKFVEDRIKAGQYASTDELVEAGIARLMLDPEPVLDEDTLHAIEEGEADGDRGDVVPWNKLKAELLGKYLAK
jgi:putative addiction module CopG family antidote